jgi:hypothetical protein
MGHETGITSQSDPEKLLGDLRTALAAAITLDALPDEQDMENRLQAFLNSLNKKTQNDIKRVIAFLYELEDLHGAGMREGVRNYHYRLDTARDLPGGGAAYFMFDHELTIEDESQDTVLGDTDRLLVEQIKSGMQDIHAADGLLDYIKRSAKEAYVFIFNSNGMDILRSVLHNRQGLTTLEILRFYLGYANGEVQISDEDAQALRGVDISDCISPNIVSLTDFGGDLKAQDLIRMAKRLAAQAKAEEIMRHGEFRDKYNQARGDSSLTNSQREQLFTDIRAILQGRGLAVFIEEAFRLEDKISKEQQWDPLAAEMLLAILNGHEIDPMLFVGLERSVAFEYLATGLKAIESSTNDEVEGVAKD